MGSALVAGVGVVSGEVDPCATVGVALGVNTLPPGQLRLGLGGLGIPVTLGSARLGVALVLALEGLGVALAEAMGLGFAWPGLPPASKSFWPAIETQEGTRFDE